VDVSNKLTGLSLESIGDAGKQLIATGYQGKIFAVDKGERKVFMKKSDDC
jgi:hypothetical protein